jgi:hypothetical protein
MKKYSKKTGISLFVFVVFCLCSGCSHFYMASSRPYANDLQKAAIIDSLSQVGKYFILRSGTNAFVLEHLTFIPDSNTLQARADFLPAYHRMYLTKDRDHRMRYIKKNPNDLKVLTEVHLYLNPATRITAGDVVIPLQDIQKIDVIKKNKAKTTTSYIVGSVIGVIGIVGTIAIISALTSPDPPPPPPPVSPEGSCPYISAYTADKFEFQGEIFTGAIYPGLERNDYMPLQMSPGEDGKLAIKISNQLKNESEHTNMADLIVVTHEAGSKVLPDENGNLYSIRTPELPEEAWSPHKANVLSLLTKKNDGEMLHFDDTLTEDGDNYVITRFKRPVQANKARLILSVKNTQWLDYLYTELGKHFGSYYTSFIKKQRKKPASDLLAWSKQQHIPLEISIQTKNGWKTIADLNGTGLLIPRELVVPVDLADVDSGRISVKLSSGFMFWEIDYTAMDFTNDADFSVENVSPSSAIDEKGESVLPQLMKRDNKYLEQPNIGNEVTIRYTCSPQPPNTARSYVLHTSGYYTHIWHFTGRPQTAFLKRMKLPGTLPVFSLVLYKKLIHSGSDFWVSQ